MTTNGSSDAPGRARPLDVRVRCVLHGDGSDSRFASVYCPVRERSTSVEACSQCERWTGLRVDAERQATFVMCHHSDEPARKPDPPADFAMAEHTAKPVGEIISKTTICLTGDMSIEQATSLLLERGLSGVPVVDESGKPIGVLSRSDLLRSDQLRGETHESSPPPRMRTREGFEVSLDAGFHESEPTVTVAEVMTPVVVWVDERSSVGQAAALMAYEGIHQLPVLSEERVVVGLVTSVDILRWLGKHSGYLVPVRERA